MKGNYSFFKCEDQYLAIDSNSSFWIKLNKLQYLAFTTHPNNLEGISTDANTILNKYRAEIEDFIDEHYPTEFISLDQEQKVSELYLAITYDCNSKCTYCFRGDRRKEYISTKNAMSILEGMKSISTKNATVILTGGEPLLHKGVFDIAKHARALGYMCSLQTNGTLITDRNIDKISEYFHNISTSIDTTDQIINDKQRGYPGHYKLAANSLKRLIGRGVEVSISSTVTQESLPNACELTKVFPEIKDIKYVPALSIGRGAADDTIKINLSDFYKFSGKRSVNSDCSQSQYAFGCKTKQCGAGISVLSISPCGDVFPCQMLHHDDFLCGNAIGANIPDLYNNSEGLNYIRSVSVETVSGCKDCDLKYLCGGACKANSFWIKDDVFSTDPCCEFVKPSILDAMAKRFK